MKILYLLIAALKFLGISILVLLLLLLFLLIIILTVPIKYNVYVSKKDDTYAYANIRWLCSIVGMDIVYDSSNKIKTDFKLFGITIKAKKPKSKSRSKSKVKVNSKAEKHKKILEKQETIKAAKAEKSSEKPKTSKEKKIKKSKESKGSTSKIKEAIAQIQSFTYKKELLVDTIRWIGKFFKALSPKYLWIEIEIGREDPADTGWLMAILSMLHPCYYSFASIVGNYEKECLCGKISANGRMSVGRVVFDFLKYIRTTSVKELIMVIKKK